MGLKNNHGGPRKGAGRPPTGKPWRVRVTLTLLPDLIARIDAAAEVASVKRSALIETVLLEKFSANSDARRDDTPAGA